MKKYKKKKLISDFDEKRMSFGFSCSDTHLYVKYHNVLIQKYFAWWYLIPQHTENYLIKHTFTVHVVHISKTSNINKNWHTCCSFTILYLLSCLVFLFFPFNIFFFYKYRANDHIWVYICFPFTIHKYAIYINITGWG